MTASTIDRSEASRELARVIAYIGCGQREKAMVAADRLREILKEAGL